MRVFTLDRLRSYTVARSLGPPSTLSRALAKLGFVQADPIRAPARAQDLTLRHRVAGYRAGDLERRYPALPIEEDAFVNYGFLLRTLQERMHPRAPRTAWSDVRWKQAHEVLAFVRERGVVHPKQVDAEFAHGRTVDWFGGSRKASTQLLEGMHYRGMLRVARREAGVRLYEMREPTPPCEDARAAHDALVDAIVAIHAPLPEATLGQLVRHLELGVPQWRGERAAALARAKARLARERIDGVDWFRPPGESVRGHARDPRVRLLAPFDPVVWDRRRFELLWGWTYRFEAYTPEPRRKLGYYALPLLFGDHVVGWANATVQDGALDVRCGYVEGRAPRDVAFRRELDAEVERLREFLVPR